MTSLFLAAILGVVYLYLRRKDARMLRNGIVLVAAVWFAVVGMAEILSQWFPWTQWISLGLVVLTPLAVIVLAGFLIGNGATMIRQEGRSVGNLLSLLAGLALLALPVLAALLVVTLNPLAIGLAALLFALLPVVNPLTGGTGLLLSIAQGQWSVAGFDLAMLVFAVLHGVMAFRLRAP